MIASTIAYLTNTIVLALAMRLADDQNLGQPWNIVTQRVENKFADFSRVDDGIEGLG